MEKYKAKAKLDLRNSQKSFSEKADMLSRFVEDEVSRAFDVNQETKSIVGNLTESLKQSILGNEGWKADCEDKIIKLDRGLSLVKEQIENTENGGESIILMKMRELQAHLESHLAVNSGTLEERMDKLASIVDASLGSFEKDLAFSRENLARVVQHINQEIGEQHRLVC